MAREDHYAVLGVPADAPASEIKQAYRRLTLQWHPDRHPDDPDAQERFRAINRAYDVLGDPAARAAFDAERRLPERMDRFDGQTAMDLLDAVVGDVFGQRRRKRLRGRDVRYTLTLSLAEAALGCRTTVEFESPGPCGTCGGSGTQPGGRAPATCPVCQGSGEVKAQGLLGRRHPCGRCDGTGMIQLDPCSTCRGRGTTRRRRAFDLVIPPATEGGAERVLQGQGEPGRFGGEPGDLRVTIAVRPDPDLERDGATIRGPVWLSPWEAALGARVPVRTLDGVAEVDVPPGVAAGARLRLRGKGVPGGGGRGDQLLTIHIETPALPRAPARRAALEAAYAALAAAYADAGEQAPQRPGAASVAGDGHGLEPAGAGQGDAPPAPLAEALPQRAAARARVAEALAGAVAGSAGSAAAAPSS